MNKKFISQLSKFNLYLEPDALQKIDEYVEFITLRNQEQNLISKNSINNIYIDHIADSLSFALIDLEQYKLDDKFTLIDIGSGAGFPAIPISILYKNSQITMVESTRKKVSFINEAISKLNITTITVINERIETLAHKLEYRETYSICTARALSSTNTLLEYSLPLLKKDGIFVSYKTERDIKDINNTNNALIKLNGLFDKAINYQLEDKQILRKLMIFKKTGNTSNIYPRKPGIPAKNPL